MWTKIDKTERWEELEASFWISEEDGEVAVYSGDGHGDLFAVLSVDWDDLVESREDESYSEWCTVTMQPGDMVGLAKAIFEDSGEFLYYAGSCDPVLKIKEEE